MVDKTFISLYSTRVLWAGKSLGEKETMKMECVHIRPFSFTQMRIRFN